MENGPFNMVNPDFYTEIAGNPGIRDTQGMIVAQSIGQNWKIYAYLL